MGSGYLFLARPLVRVRAGTLAPFSRASLSAIAIACLRLVTLRPELLLSVPFFFRCIADFTRFDAARPYFATLLSSLTCVLQTAC